MFEHIPRQFHPLEIVPISISKPTLRKNTPEKTKSSNIISSTHSKSQEVTQTTQLDDTIMIPPPTPQTQPAKKQIKSATQVFESLHKPQRISQENKGKRGFG